MADEESYEDYEDYEDDAGEDPAIEKLSEIRAVNEAVIKNLEIRLKRDDEKVTSEEKALTGMMNKPWYKNLSGIGAAINTYMNAQTDLNVTHLSIIKQLQNYNKQLNTLAKIFEQSKGEIVTLQNLNNNLSVQLKDADKERNQLRKENKEMREYIQEELNKEMPDEEEGEDDNDDENDKNDEDDENDESQ